MSNAAQIGTGASKPGARALGLGAGDNFPVPCPQSPSPSNQTRDKAGCELAAQVLRSSGKLRFRATGASMMPAVWPGDLLEVRRHGVEEIEPGDVVLFQRGGGLTAHRVVEVRRKDLGSGLGGRRQESGVRSAESVVWSPESEPLPPNPQPLIPNLELVTRGDRHLEADRPVSADELLGRVTVIERGKRRLTPRQSPAARVAAWVLSRSEFATKVALKIRDTGLGKRDTGKDVRSSVFGV